MINAKNGNIYKITVDIAKARDGRVILYATNGKTQRVGSVQVNSLELRGSGQDSNSSGNSVPQNQKNATENSRNSKNGATYSLSDSGVESAENAEYVKNAENYFGTTFKSMKPDLNDLTKMVHCSGQGNVSQNYKSGKKSRR